VRKEKVQYSNSFIIVSITGIILDLSAPLSHSMFVFLNYLIQPINTKLGRANPLSTFALDNEDNLKCLFPLE
jgi:hypothetical protein